jgi:glycosyltransferase involved in cell wall biosynthesis
MFFSVIVTVFNGGAFLAPCLESILRNPAGNYELIIVDDGSTDNSGKICDNYADRYRQVTCVHTRNQGVGNARQVGLEKASGMFVIFVDGDDVWDDSFCLRKLEDTIRKNNANLYVFGFVQRIVEREGCRDLLFKAKASSFEDWHDNQDQFLSYFSNGLMFPCWNKIFRKQQIVDNRIVFIQQQMEDFRFVLEYLNVARSVVFLSEEPYVYFKRENRGLTSFAHQGMLEGYNSCHRLFLSLFDENHARQIHRIMAPQYIATINKCLDNKAFSGSELNALRQNSLAKNSLKSYSPVSLSDTITIYLMRTGRFRLLKFYRKLISRIKRAPK